MAESSSLGSGVDEGAEEISTAFSSALLLDEALLLLVDDSVAAEREAAGSAEVVMDEVADVVAESESRPTKLKTATMTTATTMIAMTAAALRRR